MFNPHSLCPCVRRVGFRFIRLALDQMSWFLSNVMDRKYLLVLCLNVQPGLITITHLLGADRPTDRLHE